MLKHNIKNFRKTKGLTQDKLAKIADIPLTTLSKIESGKIKQPGIWNVLKIAKALNVKVDNLINNKRK
jgi:DNA-binding XRE family transcriptional regulator